jgi:hypothetical protein
MSSSKQGISAGKLDFPRILLLVFNFLIALLALAGLVVAIVVLASGGKLCVDCLQMPMSLGYGLLGITLGLLLLEILAFVAVMKHIRGLMIFMVIFTIITFSISVAGTTIFLQWANAGDLGPLKPTIDMLVQLFEDGVTSWAVKPENHDAWIAWQDGALDCCGVSLRETYQIPTWRTTLHTGTKRCTDEKNNLIQDIINANPKYSEAVETAVKADSRYSVLWVPRPEYFCKTNAINTASKYTVHLGGVLGALSFFQIVWVILAIVLLCLIKPEHGGFAPVDEQGNVKGPLEQIKDESRVVSKRISMGFTGLFGMPNHYPNQVTGESLGGLQGTNNPLASIPRFEEQQITPPSAIQEEDEERPPV